MTNDSLREGPINKIVDQAVIVTDADGTRFAGTIVEARSRKLTVTYATGHKAQFTQTRHFRRSTLRGYDEGWAVAAVSPEPASLSID